MTRRTRRRLLQGASFVLAGGLLYLAFRGIDLGAIVDAFRAADYRWLPPLVVVVIGSNVLRAWRWQVMIEALPQDTSRVSEDDVEDVTLEASFSSTMIGYMMNYVAPRMGEVARTANMAARTRLRFSSLFGTVISERLFDMAVLALATGSGLLVVADQLPVLQEQLIGPGLERLGRLPFETIALVGGGTLLVVGLGSLWAWHRARREDSLVQQFWEATVQPALVSLREGMETLVRSPRRGVILGSTAVMWFGYLLMAYIPFRMLGLTEPYGIGLLDAWALMAIGALGILIPSPGGLGSYHFITIQALTLLYGMPEAPAATYAVLAHAAQLVFYSLLGGLALLYQGRGLSTLFPSRSKPSSASSRPAEAPAPESRG